MKHEMEQNPVETGKKFGMFISSEISIVIWIFFPQVGTCNQNIFGKIFKMILTILLVQCIVLVWGHPRTNI